MPAREIIQEIRVLKRLLNEFNENDTAYHGIQQLIQQAKARLDAWDAFSYHNQLCYWCGNIIKNGFCDKCKF